MTPGPAESDAVFSRQHLEDYREFSIHGLVRVSIPKTFPHASALLREIEPFQTTPTGDWDLLILEPGRGSDEAGSASAAEGFNNIVRLEADSVRILRSGDRILLSCSRDPLPYFLVLLEWLLLLKNTSLVHAAAVALNGQGVLLPAAGGVGKTAAVRELCRVTGSAFLGDDLAILSESGEILSYPKPLFLYPYHRSLFPHVFARKKKLLVPAWLTIPVAALRKAVRPTLRRFPRLEEIARRYTPEHLHTSARQALPDVQFLASAPLALAVFLERTPGETVSLEEADKTKLAARMAAVLLTELGEPAQKVLRAGPRDAQLSLGWFSAQMESLLCRALDSTPAYNLKIPSTFAAIRAAAVVVEQVKGLLRDSSVPLSRS